MPESLTQIAKTIVHCIKIKSGQGVRIRFPDDNSECRFTDKCCQCGHTCDTVIKLSTDGRTMDVTWHKMDDVN